MRLYGVSSLAAGLVFQKSQCTHADRDAPHFEGANNERDTLAFLGPSSPFTPPHSTPLHSTPLHSTPLYSTLLYSTLLYSTLLYSRGESTLCNSVDLIGLPTMVLLHTISSEAVHNPYEALQAIVLVE
jgi:hypothetical protein